MRLATLPSASKARSQNRHVVAPMKGMNTASPITETPNGYGLRLENVVARSDGIHTRQGFEYVATGLDGAVTTLMAYPSHVVAATTSAGAPWQWSLMSNPGGVYLMAVNGSDYLRAYNGTTWSTLTLDNLDTRTVASICTHQSRVFFGSSVDLTLYYLPTDAIMGAVSPMPLGHLCRKGGKIAAIASLTQDAGRNGTDQLLVITTEGEAVLWSGNDPDVSATWSIAGVWNVPKPIGRRCLVPHGGSLAYLCVRGLLSIPQTLSRDDPEKQNDAISEAIWPTFCDDIQTGAWEMVESAEHEVLIVNGPRGQYVKSGTGAWSTWQMPYATTWITHRGELYFGTSDGSICRYTGMLDGTRPISAFIVDRYDRLKSLGIKTASQVRLHYKAAKPYTPRVKMLTNYSDPLSFNLNPLSVYGAFDSSGFNLAWFDTFTADDYQKQLAPSESIAHFTDGTNYYWPNVTWSRQPSSWLRPVTSRQGLWRGLSAEGTAFALTIGLKTTVPIVYTGYDMQYEVGASL